MDDDKINLDTEAAEREDEVRILRERLAKMDEIFKRSQVQAVTSKLG